MVTDFILGDSKITADGDCNHEIKMLAPWKESYDQPRQHIKKQIHYFANKVLPSQSNGFPSSHVWMWELDYKESWALKSWCFWIVVLEKTLESPLDCKEIQPVHPKGNQSWISLEGLVLKLKLQYFGHLKNGLIGKDSDVGKDWRQEEKRMTEDEMVGCHHWLMDMSLSKLGKLAVDREACCVAANGVSKSWTWLSNWTELKWTEGELCSKTPPVRENHSFTLAF